MKDGNKYYTVQQVASLLQVHWQSVLNYIKRGELEAVQLGRGYRISAGSLKKFTDRRSTKRGKQ